MPWSCCPLPPECGLSPVVSASPHPDPRLVPHSLLPMAGSWGDGRAGPWSSAWDGCPAT